MEKKVFRKSQPAQAGPQPVQAAPQAAPPPKKEKKPGGVLRAGLRRVETGFDIVVRLALLVPLLLGMVWVNFTVDRSGLFHGDSYEHEVAEALINGQNLRGYDQMNEREIYPLVAQALQQPYDTLAFGSSRILALRQQAVGGSFLNCGMSNADYRDILSTFYLFEKAEMLPKNVILSIDPSFFYNNEAMLHPYSDVNLFNEFLTLKLGFEADYVVETEDTGKYKALWDPAYLQGNVDYYFTNDDAGEDPGVVKGDLYSQTGNVKLGDGSVLYEPGYRDADSETVQNRALEDTAWFGRLRGYRDLNPELLRIFRAFIEHLQAQNIRVVFLLLPFHPLCYNYASEKYHYMSGMFKTEDYLRELAVEKGIALYGSYNPFVGEAYLEENFYDGLHVKPETVARIFPGMQQVEKNSKSGHPTSPLRYGGEITSLSTAELLVAQRYEICAPEELRLLEKEVVDGYESYIFGRFAGAEENALQLARYAVTMQEGTVYRYDDLQGWVIDLRFPE